MLPLMERIQRPVMILAQMEGILTGIRQLRRPRRLETEVVQGLDFDAPTPDYASAGTP